MPRIPIVDLHDPRLASYRSLKATNETRDLPEFVVEGEKLLEDLLGSRYPLVSAVSAEAVADRIAAKLPAEAPHFVLPRRTIAELVGYNFHQGVVGVGRRLESPTLVEALAAAGQRFILIVAPTLRNPENLGAIIRAADVFGAAGILVGASCPDPLSRRVLRVSMGTALRLPVITSSDLAADLANAGRLTLAATVTDRGARSLREFARSRPDRLALLLGSEAHGLASEWVELCHERLTIAMRPGAESLNVAVAAAIALYELTATG